MATSDDDLVDEDEDDAVLDDQLDAMDAMDDLADDDFAALQESWDAGQDHAAQHLADDEYIRLTCEAVNLAAEWLRLMRERINFIYAGGNLLHSRRRWNRDATFPYWFGWGMRTTQQIRALRRKIVRMHSWFTPGKGATGLRIIVVKERGFLTTGSPRQHLCTLHNAAYTISPVVYLCPTFFDDNRIDLDRAELLIHELTHRLVQGTSASMGLGFFPGSPVLWGTASAIWATVHHPCVTGSDGECRPITGQGDDDRRLARHLARHRPLAARRSPSNWAFVAREIGTGIRRHLV